MPSSSSSSPSERPLAVVSLSAAGHFFNDGYANIYPTLVPLVAEAMGFGLVSGAIVIQAVRMASSILQPLFGALADQRPSPYAAPIGLGVIGVATALLGFVHPAIAFVALAVVAGAANGAYHPPSLALVRAVAGTQPGRFTSVFLVGGTIGRAVGPLLMVSAAALFGLRGVTVLALPGIALAILLLALAPRSAAYVPRPARRAEGALDMRSTWAIVRDRLGPFSLVLLMAVARGTVTSAVSTFWPLLHGHAVSALFSSAGVIAVMMLAGSVGNVVGGSISDRVAPHRLIAATAVGAALSLAAFAVAGGLWIYPFAALAGLFAMSTNAVTAVLGQNLIPERVATASGLALGFGNALTSGVTALLALAAATYGGEAALLIAAAVALLGLPAALVYPLVERRHRARMTASAGLAQNA
jgi:MFS transporter, FSR family, fosmidomycin resistance protein